MFGDKVDFVLFPNMTLNMKAFQRRIFMAGFMTQTETETEPFKAFTMVSFNIMIMM